MEVAVFSALGEPSRLQIVELLGRGPLGVGEIADGVGIRQPQASKHLRVLAECGIVGVESRSRRRIYHLEPEPLDRIARWVDSFDQLWQDRLDSLGNYLQTHQNQEDEP